MITHILKNGQVVKDITGHVVKKEESPVAYAVLEQKRKEKRKRDD